VVRAGISSYWCVATVSDVVNYAEGATRVRVPADPEETIPWPLTYAISHIF